jgi:acetyl esterase/lipase
LSRINRSLSRTIISVVFLIIMSGLPAFAQNAIETDGIVYRKAAGRELLLDVARPSPQGVARPAIVFLCGNAWGYARSINREQFSFAMDIAVAKGYVAVDADYSSSRENNYRRAIGTFPAQVHDVKCAIRFLRAHAKEYDIDPDRIAVVGFSSGANLGLMLALTRPTDGLEGEDSNSGFSSAVQAVVNFAGPADLVLEYKLDAAEEDAYMGGSLKALPDLYRRASPISYVRPDGPPILTIQGDQDLLAEQSILFDKKMKEAGARHTLVIKKGAGHTDFVSEDIVWEFLANELNRQTAD